MLTNILKEAKTFYSLDYKNPNFSFSNSLICNRSNYSFFSIIKNRMKFSLKLSKVDILINIENYTHLREVLQIYSTINNEDKKILIQSSNIDLNKYFKESDSLKLLIGNNLNFKYSFFFLLIYIFFPFFYKVRDIFKSVEIDLNLNQLFNNKSKYVYFKLFYKYILDKTQPKFCFVGNDLTFHGRLLSYEANKTAETFSFQHGNIYDDYKTKNHLVKNFCCYSDYSVDILKKYFSGKIFLTGSFFHKKIFYSQNGLHKKFKDSIPFKKYTLIAFSGYGHSTNIENYKKQINFVEMLSVKYKSEKFVIKLHPKEKIKYYAGLTKSNNVFLVTQNDIFNLYSIYPLLENSDKLITGISTTSIEAMIKNIPVITLDPDFEYESDFLVKNRYVNYANNFQQLEFFFSSQNLNTSNSFKFSRNYFGIDHNSTLQNLIK